MLFSKTDTEPSSRKVTAKNDKRLTLNQTLDQTVDEEAIRDMNGTIDEENTQNEVDVEGDRDDQIPDIVKLSLKEIAQDQMPLKQKVVLGPIAKYKQYGKRVLWCLQFRSISMEADCLFRIDILHINAGDARH